MRNDKLLGLVAGALFISVIDSLVQQNNLDKLKLRNSELLQQYKSLKEKWDIYANSGSSSYELAHSLENIKKQLSQTNFELMSAKEALTKASLASESLRSSNTSLSTDKRSLAAKLSATEDKLYIKQLALVEAEDKNEFLRKQNESLRLQPQYALTHSHYDLAHQNERLKQQVFSHQTEISNLKNEIILLSRRLVNSDNSLANATLKLNKVSAEYNELYNNYMILQSNYSVLTEQHKQTITQIAPLQRLKNELVKLQKDIQEKEIELKASYADLEGLHKTYAQDKKRLEEMIVLLKSKLQQIRNGELEMPIKPKAKI